MASKTNITTSQEKFVDEFEAEEAKARASMVVNDPIFEAHVGIVMTGLPEGVSDDYAQLGMNLRIAIGAVAGERDMTGHQRRDCVVEAICRHYERPNDDHFKMLVKDLIQALHNERFNDSNRCIQWNTFEPPAGGSCRPEPMDKPTFDRISHLVIMRCTNGLVGGVHSGNVFSVMRFTIEEIGKYNVSNKEEMLREIMMQKVLPKCCGDKEDLRRIIDANLSVVSVMYREHKAEPVHRDYAAATSIVWLMASAASGRCCIVQ